MSNSKQKERPPESRSYVLFAYNIQLRNGEWADYDIPFLRRKWSMSKSWTSLRLANFFSGVNAWCPTSVWSSDSSFFILSNTIDFHVVNQPQGCGFAETRPALWRFPTCERLKPKITWRELAPLNIVAFDIVIGRRDRQISLLHQYLWISNY